MRVKGNPQAVRRPSESKDGLRPVLVRMPLALKRAVVNEVERRVPQERPEVTVD